MKKGIEDLINIFQLSNRAKGLSDDTLIYYSMQLNYFSNFLKTVGISRIGKIDKTTIANYVDYIVNIKKVSNTTANTYLRAVKRFMNFLNEEKICKNELNIKMLRTSEAYHDTITDEEAFKIMNFKSYDTDSIICKFLLATGVRSKTLRNIKVNDCDFKNGTVICKTTKNRKLLNLTLTSGINDTIKNYVDIHHKVPNDFLFTVEKTNEPFSRNYLYKIINKHLSKLDINKKGVHLFRYTISRILNENGCPTADIQRWLGHSDIRVTERYINQISSNKHNEQTAKKYLPFA